MLSSETDRNKLTASDAWHQFYDLLRRGKRNGPQHKLVLRALQLGREGRLGAVVHSGELRLSEEEVLTFCNTPIEQAELPTEIIGTLKQWGVRLCGELFRFDWGQHHRKLQRLVYTLLVRTGFPPDFDAWDFGWRPVYLLDPVVLTALAQPITAFGDVSKTGNPFRHSPFYRIKDGGLINQANWVGELLMRDPARNTRDTITLQRDLAEHVPVLHAAMHLPDNWEAPKGLNMERDLVQRKREARERLYKRFGRPTRDRVRVRKGENEGLMMKRRTALVNTLKEWDMDPHLFGEIIFGCSGCHIDFKRVGVTTIHAFLALDASYLGLANNLLLCPQDYLAYWGLRMGISRHEFNRIFGLDL